MHSKDAGRLLSSLIFTTLSTTVGHPSLEAIGYSVCQGWLDIMICGSVSRPPQPSAPPGEIFTEQVSSRMDASEVSSLLRKTTRYMRTHLNLGSFEGSTGAQKVVVMRLGLAADMLLLAMQAKVKEGDSLAIADLEKQVKADKQLRAEYQASLDDLVAWLFLNARGPAEEAALSGLGNVACNTPAAAKAKRITEMVEHYLEKLGGSEEQEAATQVAVSSFVRVVKQLNSSLASAAEASSVGPDALLTLSRRTNDYFTKFVGGWLRTETIARHFVFDLGGFEFLLDTIGKRSGDQAQKAEAGSAVEGAKAPAEDTDLPIQSSLEPAEAPESGQEVTSDLYEILQTTEKDGGSAEAKSSRSMADLISRGKTST